MNALDFLKNDHQVIFRLFDQVKKSKNTTKSFYLFNKIKAELKVHTYLEEKVFYPAIKNIKQINDSLTKETDQDRELKALLDSSNLQPADTRLALRMEKILSHIENHILEEEKMFQQIEKVMHSFELEEIGAELIAEKQDYQKYH